MQKTTSKPITSWVALLTIALAGMSQAAGTGTLTQVSGWVEAGTVFEVTAQPAAYSKFDGWSGNTNNATIALDTISFTVDGARSLTATFSELRTTAGEVPYEWLATWTNANFEVAATNDWDGDGLTNEEEYWSGTNPMDPLSVLRFSSAQRSGGSSLFSWTHANVDPRIPPIVIERRTNLIHGAWEYAGQLTPTNGVNSWSPAPGLSGYFRLAVTNAP